MASDSGQAPGLGALLTREVRWFVDAPLPDSVLEWFSQGDEVGLEERIDHYDLDAARRNVGIKRRGTMFVDSKFRVLLLADLTLGPGLRGHIEDWMKISEPLGNGVGTDISHPIEVAKDLHTRRFDLDGSDETGCEAELASIHAGPVAAWSLCFETYGRPERRNEAFRAGIQRLLFETPLPSGLDMEPESCHGYPEWISSLALESA